MNNSLLAAILLYINKTFDQLIKIEICFELRSTMSYRIIIVPDGAASQLEQLGTKSKFWYHDEVTDQPMLFKEGRAGTGENWSEKACCEICKLLGLPHANYELATYKDKDGVVTNNFVPKDGRLIHGNELLAGIVDGYDGFKRHKNRQHTIRRVMAVIGYKNIGMPLNWIAPSPLISSSEILVGYLMLDALVSNQDRHHENWGLVVTNNGIHFAPSFDHASSLGRNESDENRIERLNTNDSYRSVSTYVARAKSAFYSTQGSTKTLGTLDAVLESVKLAPKAGQYWLNRLKKISQTDYEMIFESIPAKLISQPAADFALKMLELNTIRLLDAGR